MDKVMIVGGGKTIEFDNIELAQAYMRERNLTNIEVVNLDYPPLRKEIPDECYQKFELLEPRIPMLTPMSGQERRRERRAKERAKRK